MINPRVARDILAFLDRVPVVSLDDIIWSHCSLYFYLYSAGYEWKIRVFAVKSYPDDTKLRLSISRQWGKGYHRVAYVDYEHLPSLVR